MNTGALVFVTVVFVLVLLFWIRRSNSKKRSWAAFAAPFTKSEYPLPRADTAKESSWWLLNQNRDRIHKAWVTVNADGIFVWHFWKRKRYQPFRISWNEIASMEFQRFKLSNSWGPDDWGKAELRFRDTRPSVTIPWREVFVESMPETVGYTIHPKYYEQDI